MPIIALATQKGGTAKTTSAWHLGDELARRGLHTLLVDVDPQASLSRALGVDEPDANLATVIDTTGHRPHDPTAVLKPIDEHLDLLPGDLALAQVELRLVSRLMRREYAIAEVLDKVQGRYSWVILDCPPSLSLLTIAALVASEWVITPTTLDIVAFRGLGMFLTTLADIQDSYPGTAKLMGTLATMTASTTHGRDVLTALRDRPDLRMFDVTVPRSIKFAEAAFQGKTLNRYAPKHPGALAYKQLADEVISRAEED